MQIHELNTLNRRPRPTDFLAIDTGYDTAKISADELLKFKTNIPLDDNGLPDNGNDGQLLRSKGNGLTEWSNVGQPTDEQTAQAVSDWLDAHPEATTTVQDGSLTLPKFKPGELPFVTPEQYGAIGDGVTDDTQAWQDAVDSGFNVIATKSVYKCGQINVTENITIDCNGARFICLDSKLFYCYGEVTETLVNESDYSANQADYAITDANYSSYTGFAMLKGSNNYFATRDYFRAGFVCEFWDGKITTSYPIDVTGVSIEIISPITVHIFGIGDITQSNTDDDQTIVVKYGFGCTISNCVIEHSGAYIVINLDSCLECLCDNVNIKHMSAIASKDNNSYLISFSNSSFCAVKNSYMYNKNWHCITTTDVYLCYHNVIDNCKLYSDLQLAFCDHDNARNTIIINTTASSLGVCGLAVIDNCNILSVAQATYKPCEIIVYTASTIDNAIYSISNVKFFPTSGAGTGRIGVRVTSITRIDNVPLYLKKLNLCKLFVSVGNTYGEISFNISDNTTTTVYEVDIDNCNLVISLGKRTADTTLDITDYVLNIVNMFSPARVNAKAYASLGGADFTFNIVNIANAILNQVKGVYKEFHFNDLKTTQSISADFSVTDEMSGSGMHSQISTTALLTPTFLQITDIKYNSTTIMLNVVSDRSDGKKYYQRCTNGTLQTLEIT